MTTQSCTTCDGYGTTVRTLDNGTYEEPTCGTCGGSGEVDTE